MMEEQDLFAVVSEHVLIMEERALISTMDGRVLTTVQVFFPMMKGCTMARMAERRALIM